MIMAAVLLRCERHTPRRTPFGDRADPRTPLTPFCSFSLASGAPIRSPTLDFDVGCGEMRLRRRDAALENRGSIWTI